MNKTLVVLIMVGISLLLLGFAVVMWYRSELEREEEEKKKLLEEEERKKDMKRFEEALAKSIHKLIKEKYNYK